MIEQPPFEDFAKKRRKPIVVVTTKTSLKTRIPVLIGLLTMVSAAVSLGVAIVFGVLPLSSTQSQSSDALLPAFQAPQPEFLADQVLVKVKPGVQLTTVESVSETPQKVLIDAETGKVVPHVDEIEELVPVPGQRVEGGIQVRELRPTVSTIKPLFSKPAGALSSENASTAGSDFRTQWYVVQLEEGVDVGQLRTNLLDASVAEAVEPNYIAALTTEPNDAYYSSASGWGQEYSDLWALASVNVERAWDALSVKRGDMDDDGELTADDLESLQAYIFGGAEEPTPPERADVNGDDQADIVDVVYLQKYLNGTGPAPVEFTVRPVIAVIDTGLDATHVDITNSVLIREGEIPDNGLDDDGNGYIDDVSGWDFTRCDQVTNSGCIGPKEPDNIPQDDHGHGTHVSGTIAAERDNAVGVVGVCPSCRVMPLKALTKNGNGLISDLAAAIQYAANNGADVINMSWGGAFFSAALNDAIAYAHAAGVTLVAAAGNNSGDVEFFSPASLDNVIAVAAYDHNDIRSDFSNWGSSIALAAPGGDSIKVNGTTEPPPYLGRNILSLRAKNTDFYRDGYSIVQDIFYRSRGTSMAAPHVAGVAGLVALRHPEFTNEQIRAALSQGAQDLTHAAFNCGSITERTACLESDPSCYWNVPRVTTSTESTTCASYKSADACSSSLSCSWDMDDSACVSGASGCYSWDVGYGEGWDPYTGSGKVDAYGAIRQGDPLVGHMSSPADIGYFGQADAITVTGTARGANFSGYTVDYASQLYPNNWITLVNSSTPVTDGILATWDTDLVGNYRIRLTVTTTQGQETSEVRDVVLGLERGWWKDASLPLISHLVAADVDPAYPGLEIVGTAASSGGVSVEVFVRHSDGSLMSGWPLRIQNYASYGAIEPLTGATVGDVDGDGALEIVVPSWPNAIHAFRRNDGDGDGKPDAVAGWPKALESSVVVPPVISDLNGDGKAEVIVATEDGKVNIWKGDGQTYSTAWPKSFAPMSLQTTPVVANLDADADKEIVIASGSTLHILNPDGSSLNSTWPKTFGTVSHQVVVADLNVDGVVEIIALGQAQSDPHTLYIFEPSGQPFSGSWPYQSQYQELVTGAHASLAVGDMDASIPGLEIVGALGNRLYAWKQDGSLLGAGWPLTVGSIGTALSPSLADINSDGQAEVLLSTGQKIYAFTKTGDASSPSWPINLDVQWGLGPLYESTTPLIVDTDQDNQLELFSTNGRRIFAFELPGSGKSWWSMYGGNAGHTGQYSRCSDFTPFEQCNTSQQWCDSSGRLVYNCTKCSFSCPQNFVCQTNGSCASSCKKIGSRIVCLQ